MKYRNLKFSFVIDGVIFSVLNLGKEQLSGPIPRHSHSKNSYEMHYIYRGFGTLIADTEKYELSPGTFYMTGPGVEHEQISQLDNPMDEFGVYLQIDLDKKLSKSSPLQAFVHNKFWIGNVNDNVLNVIENIMSELEEKPYGYEEMLPPLLKQLTLLIIREYNLSNTAKISMKEKAISPQDLIYLTIEEAFLYRYNEITLQTLSKEINLGPRQTERLLKNHYGKSFSQMKTNARMSAASLLLTETDTSISEIALKLGYSSSEHFTNAFKKYYSVTPKNYKKRGN